MTTRTSATDSLSRRGFLAGLTAAGVVAVLARRTLATATLAEPQSSVSKPNSVFNGVHIGCITYSYRGGINTAEDTLKALIEDGLSETELMDGPIRLYAGISGGGGGRGDAAARMPDLPRRPPCCPMNSGPSSANRNWPSAANSAKCTTTRA
jgi:hypothetical protein